MYGNSSLKIPTHPRGISVCCGLMQSMCLAEKLKLETISSRMLGLICSHLRLFNKVCEIERERKEVHPYVLVHYDVLKKIMEHPAGKHSWKIKAFNLWFSANEETLSDQEQNEILKFFMDFVSKKAESEANDD